MSPPLFLLPTVNPSENYAAHQASPGSHIHLHWTWGTQPWRCTLLDSFLLAAAETFTDWIFWIPTPAWLNGTKPLWWFSFGHQESSASLSSFMPDSIESLLLLTILQSHPCLPCILQVAGPIVKRKKAAGRGSSWLPHQNALMYRPFSTLVFPGVSKYLACCFKTEISLWYLRGSSLNSYYLADTQPSLPPLCPWSTQIIKSLQTQNCWLHNNPTVSHCVTRLGQAHIPNTWSEPATTL